jgi:predicted nucleic acid-binding Zn ribbon protein
MSCCSLPVVECVVCGAWIPYDSVFAFEDGQDSEPVEARHAALPS